MNNDINDMAHELADLIGVPVGDLGFLTSTQLRLGETGLRLVLEGIRDQFLERGRTSDGAYRVGAFITWD